MRAFSLACCIFSFRLRGFSSTVSATVDSGLSIIASSGVSSGIVGVSSWDVLCITVGSRGDSIYAEISLCACA